EELDRGVRGIAGQEATLGLEATAGNAGVHSPVDHLRLRQRPLRLVELAVEHDGRAGGGAGPERLLAPRPDGGPCPEQRRREGNDAAAQRTVSDATRFMVRTSLRCRERVPWRARLGRARIRRRRRACRTSDRGSRTAPDDAGGCRRPPSMKTITSESWASQ